MQGLLIAFLIFDVCVPKPTQYVICSIMLISKSSMKSFSFFFFVFTVFHWQATIMGPVRDIFCIELTHPLLDGSRCVESLRQ